MVFNGDTGAHLLTIPNPFPASGDLFGWSTAAVAGRIVVSAPFADPGGIVDAGTVYVFRWNDP